jgi:hypothetical protein
MGKVTLYIAHITLQVDSRDAALATVAALLNGAGPEGEAITDWSVDELSDEARAAPARSTVRVRFEPRAWESEAAIPVNAEGEQEWLVDIHTATAIPDALERGGDLDWIREDDHYTPTWIKDWTGPFDLSVVAIYDHQPQPGKDAQAGDRCEHCGHTITGTGSSPNDWTHIDDKRIAP